MARLVKIWVINTCVLWMAFFECSGPRDIYDAVAGAVLNPQYLFADSEFPLCKRIRRVVVNGQLAIFIENTSQHSMHIYYTHERLRAIIMACHKYRELGWSLKY